MLLHPSQQVPFDILRIIALLPSNFQKCKSIQTITSTALAGWPSRYINMRLCGGLSMLLLQLKVTLGLLKFLPRSLYVSRRYLTVDSNVKSNFFPPIR